MTIEEKLEEALELLGFSEANTRGLWQLEQDEHTLYVDFRPGIGNKKGRRYVKRTKEGEKDTWITKTEELEEFDPLKKFKAKRDELIDMKNKKNAMKEPDTRLPIQNESTPARMETPYPTEITQPAASHELIREAPALDIDTIKQYINPNVTDQEAFVFLQLCKARGLNPFTGEAYLIKYDKSPATTVIGKDAFTQRAERNKEFDGFEAGIIVISGKDIIRREGCFLTEEEKLVGGWAKVYRKDRHKPFTTEVQMKEYNKKQAMWLKIPATMIRKVALVQALREAFPSDLGGLYDSSEVVE